MALFMTTYESISRVSRSCEREGSQINFVVIWKHNTPKIVTPGLKFKFVRNLNDDANDTVALRLSMLLMMGLLFSSGGIWPKSTCMI